MEEGIGRDDIPGSRNLGSQDYWVGVRELGELGGAFCSRTVEHGLRFTHSGLAETHARTA